MEGKRSEGMKKREEKEERKKGKRWEVKELGQGERKGRESASPS